jgi:hypothetical protein
MKLYSTVVLLFLVPFLASAQSKDEQAIRKVLQTQTQA